MHIKHDQLVDKRTAAELSVQSHDIYTIERSILIVGLCARQQIERKVPARCSLCLLSECGTA